MLRQNKKSHDKVKMQRQNKNAAAKQKKPWQKTKKPRQNKKATAK